MKDLLHNWSIDRDEKFVTTKKFDLKPKICTREWIFRKGIVKYSHEETQYYMCSSAESSADITKAHCKEFWTKVDEWSDFDHLIDWSTKFINVKINIENWESSSCSCSYLQKNFKCKHTIGIFYFLNLNEFPGLDLAIEGNAKRGRKKSKVSSRKKFDYSY
ncbi:unnamed protein product [Brachionus calyciflorus]|uniref:SWIM-type domain-containing protein n=1 Tax=Brachionus calyciflorus TaxID=104777 RepID=A0A814LBF5_9BILA|nr:unnamed protein product [Brachionus calyciflorus]